MGILADILRNNNLNEGTVERERDRILQELEDAEENIHNVVFDYLHQTAFQGTPFSKSVLGPTKNIEFVSGLYIYFIYIYI